MQRPARVPTQKPEPRVPARVIIRRVTLPRFEVIYPTVVEARAVASVVKQKRFLALAGDVDVAVGNQVVLDLAASGCAAAVTLLFRVIGKRDGTLLEWWARRETDTAALDLWIEGLAAGATQAPDPGRPQIVELCQRALKRNPFDMLAVHWSADAATLATAGRTLLEALDAAGAEALTPKVAALLAQAQRAARDTLARMSSLEGRVQARQTYVPGHQLRHARELLDTQLEVARMRGDRAELLDIQTRRREIGL